VDCTITDAQSTTLQTTVVTPADTVAKVLNSDYITHDADSDNSRSVVLSWRVTFYTVEGSQWRKRFLSYPILVLLLIHVCPTLLRHIATLCFTYLLTYLLRLWCCVSDAQCVCVLEWQFGVFGKLIWNVKFLKKNKILHAPISPLHGSLSSLRRFEPASVKPNQYANNRRGNFGSSVFRFVLWLNDSKCIMKWIGSAPPRTWRYNF